MSFLGLCGLCFEFISFWVHEFFGCVGRCFIFFGCVGVVCILGLCGLCLS